MDPVTILVGGIALVVVLVGIILYPAFKIIPFVYGASRLRAAKSKFLSDKEIKDLAHKGYKEAILIIEERKNTELLKLIDSDFSEELVQKELRRKYLYYLKKIIRYTPSNYKKFFYLLKSREGFEYMLTAIRSKTNKYYKRHVVSDLFIEVKGAKFLTDVETMTIDELIQSFRTTQYGKVIDKFADDIKKGELQAFEQAINAEYYAKLRNATMGNSVLKQLVNRLIDIHNINQATYLLENYTHFMNGGSFDKVRLDNLKNTSSIKEVVSALQGTYVEKYIADAYSPKDIVQGLYKSLKDFGIKISKTEPLGLSQFVSFYILGRNEFKNLRIVLKLINEKFEPKDIEGHII